MMAKGTPRLVAALLVLLASAAPGPAGGQDASRKVSVEGGGRYTTVDPATLAAMLARKDFVLVNVHIPYGGEIAGTDRFVPFNAIPANLDKLPTRKDARVVLYCMSGHMSTIAARTLVRLGYTDVWNLEGGMLAWEKAGHPLSQRH